MRTTVSTIDAKEQFPELVNRVVHHGEQVVLTRRGKEIAVIISYEEMKSLLQSRDKYDLREASESLKETRLGEPITLDQLKEEVT